MYSRHLQFVSTAAQAAADPMGVGVKIGEHAKMIGVAAVNLTVRNGGHVLPANQVTALPLMLKGIRSTGIICDLMTPSISPPSDPKNTDWIKMPNVEDTLALASANGINKYRITTNGGYPPNAFGKAITDHLEGYRVNFQRLADLNKKYGMQAVMHTQNSLGLALWDMMIAWKDIDPKYIGFNYCPGHVVASYADTGATGVWANTLRYIMPYIDCVALMDYGRVANADGTISARTMATGKGGQVNWVVFFQLLRESGYTGTFDTQEEYSIAATDGSNISLNAAWFADDAVFTSGRMTPALMVSTMKADMDVYKAKGAEAGWTAAQLTA
jgi:sugar phosphate isomerase/epimerase